MKPPPIIPEKPSTPNPLKPINYSHQDPYKWLENKEDPEVISLLEGENAYFESSVEPLKDKKEAIYQDILSRINETDLSLPEWVAPYFYYRKTEKGKQYPLFCRKKDSLEGEEEIYFDQNSHSEGKEYHSLGALLVSPDHQKLAYSEDLTGDESYTLSIIHLKTGEKLYPQQEGCGTCLVWDSHSEGFFFSKIDDLNRPDKIFYLGPNTDPQGVLVFLEEDHSFFVGLSRSRSKTFLFIECASNNSTEVLSIPLNSPLTPPQLFLKRVPSVEYQIDHHQGFFYQLTNQKAIDFTLLKTAKSQPEPEDFEILIPHREGIQIEDFQLFDKHLLVLEKQEGLPRIRIYNLQGIKIRDVAFEEPAYDLNLLSNRDTIQDHFKFSYSSPITPFTIFKESLHREERTILKKMVVPNFQSDDFQCRRIKIRAEDSQEIPVTLVFSKKSPPSPLSPVLQYGYGAYGISIEPEFNPALFSLLNQGFVYAIAHIRGSETLGRKWYEQGKLKNKMNSFTDFVRVTEGLIEKGLADPKKIAICGESAGGLLVGASVNLRPDLYKLVIAKVPFVDCLNSMLNPDLPLTIHEYDEWGNPEDPDFFNLIKSYTPCENLKEGVPYPHFLIMGGLNDPRVAYWEPAKWVARLRKLNSASRSKILFKTEMGAGHGGPTGRYDYLKEIALDYAIIHWLVLEEEREE